MNDNDRVTYFGETDARNKRVRFGIKKKDRSRHMYVIGKTGMGKSTLLETLAIQDINNGEGLAFIDPHGKTADLLLEYIPEHRIKDVIYFAPFDLDHPISFNVLEDVGPARRHLVANGLMSAFKKIWVDAFSARMEYILSNIMLGLLEYPDSTLMGVNRMLVDKDFRKTIVDNITDPSVKSFWVDEYAKYTDKFAAEAAPAIQNKVGQFVANPLVRNIIGQPKSSFDIRDIMDTKKIFIVNLSKGRVGEANANLLGAMIITKIYLAAMSRADLNEDDLKKAPEFYLYVDEFQSFANESFADILSEARKYKLALIIAHQYIEQMTEEVRAAVFGNVGTMAIFRVGAFDAAVFEKEFVPQFTAEDIVNLQQYQLYLKLMIDGVTSPPFSAMGMAPIPRPPVIYVKEIIDTSRQQFAKPRDEVEDFIKQWHVEKIPAGPNAPIVGGVNPHDAPDMRGGGMQGAHGGGQGGGQRFDNRSDNRFENRSEGRFDSRPPRGDFDKGFDRGGNSGGGDRGFDRGGDRGFDRGPSRNFDQGNRAGGGFGGERNNDRGFDRAPDRGFDRAGDRGTNQNFDRGNSRPKSFDKEFDQGFGKAFEKALTQGGDSAADGSPELAPDNRGNRMDSRDRQAKFHQDGNLKGALGELIGTASGDSRNASDVSQSGGGDQNNVRNKEQELRQVVSLNHLRDKNEQENLGKNDKKTAKPENVLALKEALTGLFGDDPQKNKPINKQPEIKPEFKPEHNRNHHSHDDGHGPAKQSHHGTHSHQAERQTSAPSSAHETDKSNNKPESKEVDLDTLTKVLGQ